MKKITLLIALLFAFGLQVQAQVLNEDFEGTLEPNGLPTGWTETGFSTDGIWSVADAATASSEYFIIESHTNFVYTNDDACDCDKSADRLITPSLDLSALSTVELTYSVFLENDEIVTIEVSTDGGTTWTPEGTLTSQEGWRNAETLDLSSYAGESDVLISFVYNDDGFWNYGMAIDDVKVAEIPTCLAPTELFATTTSLNTATIGWTASLSTPSDGYEYAVSSSVTPPTSGTTTTNTTESEVAIFSEVENYLHVRANCGGGDFSAWTTYSFIGPTSGQIGILEASAGLPINSCFGYSYSQQLYFANELTVALEGETYINKIKFFYDTAPDATANWNNWTIYMANTSKSSFDSTTDWISSDELIQVFSGDLTIPAAGNWMEIELDSGFMWDGSSNLVIAVDENISGYNCTANFGVFNDPAQIGRTLLHYSDGTNANPSSPPAAIGWYYTVNTLQLETGAPPSCFVPTSLTANATVSTADLGWTAGDAETAWNVEIVVAGATPTGTGTATANNPFEASSTTSGDAFTENTDYEFYVQADCGGGDTSTWAGPFAFSTACGSTTVPYVMDFETATVPSLPECTSMENIGVVGNDWKTSGTAVTGFSGNKLNYSYHSYLDVGNADSWFYTQGIELVAGTAYQISYKYGNNSTTYTESMKVAFGTSPASIAMINPLADYPAIQTSTPIDGLHTFTVDTDGVYYFGFNVYSVENQNQLYVDDIAIIVAPACPEPTAVTADVTHETADLSWTAGNTETAWNYVWQLAGAGTPVDGDGTAITTTSYEATGLDSETEYEFWVQADCGDGLSAWVGPFAVTTLAVPPVNDDLCNAIALDLNTACADATYTNIGSTVQTGEPSGDCWWGGDEVASSVWFSFVAPAIGEVTVTTDFVSNTFEDTNIAVYEAATDCNDLTTLGDQIACDEDGGETVALASTVFLAGLIEGNIYYVQVNGYDGAQGDFCIEVNYETCPAPTDVAVSEITSNSAEFTWTAGDVETTWNVEIVEAGTEPTGIPTATDVDNPYVATNLSSETDYELYVQAICDADNLSDWIGPLEFSTAIEPVEVSVDAPVMNSTYCYTSSDIKEWMFVSADGAPLTITFNAGTLEDTFSGETYDDLWIYDGTDDTGVLLFDSDVDGFILDGLTFNAMSGNIYMYLDSDSSVSCESDADIISLDFNVEVMECNAPANLAVTAVDTNLQFTWEEVPSAMGYEYFVVLAGEDPISDNYVTSGTTVSGQEVSALLTGVDINVDYDIYVNAICATDFSSENSMITYTGMSVHENTIVGFSYFPNPVKNTLSIKALENIKAYKIYNMLGQVIISNNPENLSEEIDMSNFQSGTYFLKVAVGKETGTFKIVKQ